MGLFSKFALCATLVGSVAGKGKDVIVGSEVLFDSEVNDAEWFGSDKNIVVVQTRTGKLYRSTNAGEGFSEITAQLGNSRLSRIMKSPAAHDVAVGLVSVGIGAAFSSRDGGLKWEKMNVDMPFNSWVFHRSRPEWALASHWSPACASFKAKADGQLCSHDLYVTKDLGRTFELVATHVVQFSWGGHHMDRIFFTHFRNKAKLNQPRLTRWMEGVDLARTDDFGKTVEAQLPDGNKFQISNGYILAVRATSSARQSIELMVSTDDGGTFQAARLPEDMRQRSYALLDTSEGAVVLHVNHHGGDTGDIFISDAAGVNFTHSLSGNMRMRGLCAFEKVMNLKGIYIANVKVGADGLPEVHPKDAASEEPNEAVEGGAGSTQSETQQVRFLEAREENEEPVEGSAYLSHADRVREFRSKAKRRLGELAEGTGIALEEDTDDDARRLRGLGASAAGVRTVISFDMGGAWTYLKAPKVDSSGKAVTCAPETCWLHLHGITEIFDFAPIYSYRNAVGILMGSGNVGPSLTFDKSQTNTYLSRDGGLTWSEVRKGTFIYEYGNHGGLLVMADMTKDTASAVYSWSEGERWDEFPFAEKPMRVHNVLIEPNATATKFVIFGRRGAQGVLHLLDFGKLHQKVCSGIETAGAKLSDYENWSPSDGSGAGKCILGHHSVYTRRKQMSECFNSEGVELPRSQRNCPCTQESFECEVGFTRQVGSLTCQEDPTSTVLVQPPAVCHGKYPVSAYRRVPGDTCSQGWIPPEVLKPCPVTAAGTKTATVHKSSPGAAAGFVVGLGFVFIWCFLRTRVQPGAQPAREQPGKQAGQYRAPTEMVGVPATQGDYAPPEA